MILQDPKFSLNPVMRVGDQISEAFLAHSRSDKTSAKQQSLELMESVRIRNPERVYKLYPHEISGGMGQRIMIAMMLVAGPRLVIADEPTSALDVTVRMEVLSVLDEMVSRRHVGLLFISHDLNPAPLISGALLLYKSPFKFDLTGPAVEQPADAAQDCGLATPGLAHQTEDLPLLNCKRDLIDGNMFAADVVKDHPQIVYLDRCHYVDSSCSSQVSQRWSTASLFCGSSSLGSEAKSPCV